MITRGFVLLSLLILGVGCASKPKSIEEWSSGIPNMEDKVKITSMDPKHGDPSGKGPIPYLQALGAPPKRVALVSFRVAPHQVRSEKDSNFGAFKKGQATQVADTLLKLSLPEMKKNFKDNGMDLLEPSEYLTDASKKKALQNFNVKVEGENSQYADNPGVHRVANLYDKDEGIATGYPAIDHIMFLNMYPSVQSSFGSELSKALGVDAVFAVEIHAGRSEKGDIHLMNTSMYIFGPNPVKGKSGNEFQAGHTYGATSFEKSLEKVLLIPKDLREEPVDPKLYNGFEKVTDGLSKKLASYIKDKSSGK